MIQGFDFLERIEVSKILKEQRLSVLSLHGNKLQGNALFKQVDLFVIITPKLKNKTILASGLIIYDARNGMQIANTSLPEIKPVDAIVSYIIKSRDKIKYSEKQLYLSLAAVRNAGVPARFKYGINYFSAEIKRQLNSTPEISF